MEYRNLEPGSLQEKMDHLLTTGLNSDITLVVGEEEKRINVHRLILSSRSTVFEAMLDKRWTTDQDQVEQETLDKNDLGTPIIIISLPSHDFETFQLFLQFLYTDYLGPIHIDALLQVLQLADLYDVPKLQFEVVRRLKAYLATGGANQSDTYLKIFTHARLIDPALGEEAFLIFLKHIRTAADNNQYLDWDVETVKAVLSQNFLNFREIDLFKALLKWKNHSANSNVAIDRSEAIPELLKLIRFPTMSTKVYADEVVPMEVFSKEQNLEMFMHFANPVKWPISYNTFPRSWGHPSDVSQTSDVMLYWGRTVANTITKHTVTRSIANAFVPELRLEVFSPVGLNGVGVHVTETLTLLNSPEFLIFTVIVRSGTGLLLSKTTSTHAKECGNEYATILFDQSLILKSGKGYDIQVLCTASDPIASFDPPRPASKKRRDDEENAKVILVQRKHDENQERSMSIRINHQVWGRMTFYSRDINVPQTPANANLYGSNWIRNFITSAAPGEPEPCIIT